MRLTRDEIILMTVIVVTLVVGAVVKQYRAERREAAALSAETGAPTTSRR